MTYKQVIVVRKDLGMRKGKMVAQGCHATKAFLLHRDITPDHSPHVNIQPFLDNDVKEWFSNGSTTICVGAKDEQDLKQIYDAAKEAGLRTYSVTDAGKTELEPGTVTCVAIGPNKIEDVDNITGKLELL